MRFDLMRLGLTVEDILPEPESREPIRNSSSAECLICNSSTWIEDEKNIFVVPNGQKILPWHELRADGKLYPLPKPIEHHELAAAGQCIESPDLED